jgi:hypothetical protein
MNKLLGKHGVKPLFYQFFRKMKLTFFIISVSILCHDLFADYKIDAGRE